MKKYSSHLLSVMFSMGISVGALKASSCVLEQNSTQDLPTPTLITPEIEVSIIPDQPSGTSQLTSGPIMLPTTSQIISRDTDQTVTVTGEPPISTDQETNIPTSQTVLQPTGIPVFPQMCIDPATSTSNNETAPVVINPIVTLAQPTAPCQNNDTVMKQRKYNPNPKNLSRYLSVINTQDIPTPLFMDAVKKLNSIGIVEDKHGRTGFLAALVFWCNMDQRYCKKPNRNRQKNTSQYRVRLCTSIRSLSPSTLSIFSNDEQKNMMDVLELLKQHYKEPYATVIQYACVCLREDPAALPTMPSILVSTRGSAQNSSKQNPQTNTPTTQTTLSPVSSYDVSLAMSPGSSQITHKPDDGTMQATVEQEKTPTSKPSSPSTSDKGAIGSDYDMPSTSIDLSTSELHGTNDIVPNNPHTHTAKHNPVNQDTLEQKVDLLIAKVTSLERLISQLVTNSNLAIVSNTCMEN